MQILTSAFHLFGTACFFAHDYFQTPHWAFTKHNDDLNFWGGYVFSNGIWVVVPALLIVQSLLHFQRVENSGRRKRKKKKTNKPKKA